MVDVTRACVIRLPQNARYVALSYVGGGGADPVNDFKLLLLQSNAQELEEPGSLNQVQLPRTISDAITVCEQLCQRYLSIDRLCIIQDELGADSV